MGIKKVSNYISNLGKSVTYAAYDRIKETSPAVGSFAETNSELFKDVYQNIRNYKVTYNRGAKAFKSSKIYEAGDTLKKSLIEDIKSGKFYNKERSDAIDDQIIGGGIDDFDVDMNFDVEDPSSESDSSNKKPKNMSISRVIHNSNKLNTDALSMAIAKTGEYVVENQRIANNVIYSQNLQAYTTFNKNLNAINDNISNLLDFSTNVLKIHAENSKKYYETTTQLLQQQNKSIELLVQSSKVTQLENKKRRRSNFSDMIDSNDVLDINSYLKNIKNNAKNMSGTMSSMMDMFGGDSNPLLSFVSSPLQFIPQMIIAQMTPQLVGKGMEEFNKSFSGFFGSMVAKINTMKDSDNTLLSKIGSLFGVSNIAKKDIDSSKYNKGKVDWDGKSRKALTEVIPTQLSKIISILSGRSAKVYDYENGNFVDSKDIKKRYNNTIEGYQKNATFDMRDEFEKYMKLMTFNSLEERKDLLKDIDKFFKQMYNSGKIFDINSKTIDTDYFDYNVSNSKNFKLIRQMFKSAPRYKQQQINAEIIKQRDAQTSYMNGLEDDGTSIYGNLFNGSNLNEFVKQNKITKKDEAVGTELLKNNLKTITDNKGHNVFFYLQNLYKEAQYIRTYGVPNGGGYGGKSRRNHKVLERPSINSIQIPNKANVLDTKQYIKKITDDKKYLEKEEKRIDKAYNVVNISDIDDENAAANSLGYKIKSEKLRQKLEESKKTPDSFIDRLLDARSISGKGEVALDALTNLSKKPIAFFTNVLKKTDQRMYEIIYGKPNGSNPNEDKGFIGTVTSQIKNTFSRLNSWLDEHILNPLKEKLEVDNMRDAGKKFLGMFGIDVDKVKESLHDFFLGETGIFTSTKNAIKKTFSGAFNTAKDSLKTAYSPIVNKFRERFPKKDKSKQNAEDVYDEQARQAYEQSKIEKALRPNPKQGYNVFNMPQGPVLQKQTLHPGLKTDEGKAVKNMSDSLSTMISNWLYGNMPHYAEGGEIDRAQVATVGEGEVVLPKKLVDKIRKAIERRKTNKNVSDDEDAIQQPKIFGKVINFPGTKTARINSTLLRTTKSSKLQSILDKLTPEQQDSLNEMGEKLNGVKNQTKKTIETKIDPFIAQVGSQLKSGAKMATDSLFGRDPKAEAKGFSEVTKDVTSNISKYAPEAIGAGLLGGGLSLVTGAIGGPLLGASVGAGISLVKNSEKAQEWLFGKTVDGKREGGLVSKNTIGVFKKYFPDLKTYGIAGGLTGLAPFVPFGPIGGLLLGSAFGVAKNNEAVQKALFGSQGLISDKSKDKIKKALPKAAAGALVGTLTGPFGFMGNALLGSAIGMATTSDKFKTFMIGTYNEKTKQYENGVLSQFREALIDPLKKSMKSFSEQIGDFLKNDIFNPLKKFFEPLKTEVKHVGKGALKGIGSIFDKLFEGAFGTPFHKFVQDKFVSPMSKLILNPLKAGVKFGKKVVSAPFKGLGYMGDRLRAKQIKKGYADNMSAEQRLLFRKNNKIGSGDKFRDIDLFISNLSQEGLDEINSNVDMLSNTKKEMSKRRKDIATEMGEKVSSRYDYSTTKKIMKSIRDKKFDNVSELMGFGNLNPHTNPQLVKDLLNANSPEEREVVIDSIRSQLGDKASSAIIKRIKSGDTQIAAQMLKISMEGNTSDRFMNKTSDHVKAYNSLNMQQDDITKDIDKRLGFTFDFDQKKQIVKMIKAGQYDKVQEFINHLPPQKAEKLMKQIEPLIKQHQETSNKKTSVYNKLKNHLNTNDNLSMLDRSNIMKKVKNGSKHADVMKMFGSNMTTDQKLEMLGFINDKYKNYVDMENTSDNQNNIRKKLFDELSEKTGMNINDKNIDKFMANIKSEMNFKDKHYSSKEEDSEEKAKEDQWDMTQTYHTDVLSLFTQAVELLEQVVDPTKENRTMSENTKNKADKQQEEIDKGDRSIVKDAKGNVVEYIKDNRGEWAPDLSDASTKAAINNAKKEDAENNTLLSKIGSVLTHKKDDKEEKGDKKKDKKDGIFGKLLGFLGKGKGITGGLLGGLGGILPALFGGGIFKKALGIGAGIMALPQIIKFTKDVAVPVMSGVYQNSFKPWLKEEAIPWLKDKGLPALAGCLKVAVKEIPGMIGDAVKFAFTDIIPTLAGSIGEVIGLSGKNGEQSVGGRAATVIGRHIVTGGSTSKRFIENAGKKTTEKFAEKGILGKAIYAARHPFKLASAGAKRLGVNALDKASGLVNKGYSKIEKSVGGILEKRGMQNFTKTGITATATKAVPELVEGFIKSIKNFLSKLLTNGTIVKMIGAEKAEKLLKNFVPNIIKEISERAVKCSAEVTGKLLGAASTAGLLNVAFAVTDFISGFRDAKNIMSITQEPSFGMKIVAGLIKSLNGLFIITSFIPEKLWVTLVVDYVMPLFGAEDKEFKEMRDQARKEVDDYNKKNGTDYNVEQYNKMKKDKEPGFWKNAKNKFVEAGHEIASKVGQKWTAGKNWVKEKANQGANWVQSKWDQGKNWAKSGWNSGMDWLQEHGIIQNAQGHKFAGGFGLGDGKQVKPDPRMNFPISDKPLHNAYGDGGNQGGTTASTNKPTIKNGMVYYSQMDPRWKDQQYGTGTIGSSACGPTSAAMVISSLTGKSVTPVDTAAWSVSHGFRVPNVGTSFGLYKPLAENYGLDMTQTSDKNQIMEALKNHQPVIFSGQGRPPFTNAGHFVVGTGLDGSDRMNINDPINISRSASYPDSDVFGQMKTAFIANKALDGKLVDSAGSSSSASGATAPQQEDKPSIMSLFDDFGKAMMNGMNRFYGFDAIASTSGSNATGSPIGGEASNGLASPAIVEYIKSKEGFKANRYLDSGGTPTIGYGSTHGWIMSKSSVTEAEATKALQEEVNQTASEIKADLDKKNVKLNQHQFDALCSFGYNLGVPTLLKSSLYKMVCSGSDPNQITQQFKLYDHCGKQVLPGLTTRRREEAEIFTSGSAPSYKIPQGGGFGELLKMGGGFGPGDQPETQSQQQGVTFGSMFSDLGKTITNAAGTMLGLAPVNTGTQNPPSDASAGGNGQVNKSADKVSDDYFRKTLGATITSEINPSRVINGHKSPHFGIDYASKQGTDIKSPISGVVCKNESLKRSYGNYIVVKDDKGCYHYFAHMEKQSPLAVGTRVTEGQSIGYVGQTGNATGPHLHYEVRGADGNTRYNPNDYLRSLYNNQGLPQSIGGQEFKLVNQGSGNYVATPKVETKNSNISDKLLTAIIGLLTKICDNTNALSEILKVLSKVFDEKGDKATAKKLSNINTKSKPTQQVVNVLKDGIKNNGNGNDYLLSVLNSLSME